MFHLCSWNLWSLLLQNVWPSAAQNNHYTEKIRKVCGILICVPCLILCQERSSLLRTGFEQRRRRRWRKAPGFIIFIIRHNFTLLNWKPVPSRPVSGLNFNLVTTANTVYGNLCFWQEFSFLLGLSGGRMVKKHGKNYECCPVSLVIVRSQRLSWIQVLNCQNWNQCLKGHKSLGFNNGHCHCHCQWVSESVSL